MWANDPQFVRQKLYERDRGVCAMCGVDAERMEWRAKIASVWEWCRRTDWHTRTSRWVSRGRGRSWMHSVPKCFGSGRFAWNSERVQRAVKDRLERMKLDGWPIHRRQSWWEADHIVPVVEGGGQCGPENYRTLCIRCHRKVTRELRQRLKQANGSVAPHDNKQAGLPEAGIGKLS